MLKQILTIHHFAASELLQTVEFITTPPVYPCHVIPIVAFAQTLVVERLAHVVIVTTSIIVGVVSRFTAFRVLDAMQPLTVFLVAV